MAIQEYTNVRLFVTSDLSISSKKLSTFTITATSTVAPKVTSNLDTTQYNALATVSSEASSPVSTTLLTLPSTTFILATEQPNESATSSSQSDILPSNVLTGSRSLELGLAVGLPIAVSAVIAGVLGFWYYMKRRGSKPEKMYTTNNQFYDLKSFDNPYDKVNNSSSLTLKNEIYQQQKPVVEIQTPVKFKDLPNRIQRRSMQLLKRLSTTVKIEDANNLISPLFLKRFNLNKPTTPRSAESSYKQTTVNPTKEKKLPKLPSFLHEISFDNLERSMEDSVFIVTNSYQRKLSDELSINTGDKVSVIKVHHDGWCTVQKLPTKEIGVVPKLCLAEVT